MITHGGSTSRPSSRGSASALGYLKNPCVVRMAFGSLAQASSTLVVNQSRDQSVVRTALYLSTSPVVCNVHPIQHG